MNTLSGPETGRVTSRTRGFCLSCEQRVLVGEPKANDLWPQKLRMNSMQLDLLLVAAAEFIDLCREADEIPDIIDFLDWVRPDALSTVTPVRVEAPVLTLAEKRRRQGAA